MKRLGIIALILALVLAALPASYAAPTDDYTVTSTDDVNDGACNSTHCSLREAILTGNTAGGGNIVFDIPTGDSGYNAGTGVWTIQPTIALPVLTGGDITIDGYSQDGAAVAGFFTGPATIVIEIDGTNVTGQNGFNIGSAGNTIKGLAINRFGWSGIAIGGASAANNTISGCYIGTDPDGTAGLGNTLDGVSILLGAHDNTIGGTSLADLNVIGDNGGDGVGMVGDNTTGNVVVGNYIGFFYSATDLGNESYGVHIYGGAHGNTIGAHAVDQRIAANDHGGIHIAGANTRDNVVTANSIGVSTLGNNLDAVSITDGAHDNTIGPDNEIAHNSDHGVFIFGTSTMSNTVSGNEIHNNWYGVVISSAQHNTVGGDTESERNVIVGNDEVGICIVNSAQNNTVSGNYIGVNSAGIVWPNGSDGVEIGLSAHHNVIGPDNVISGNNGYGIYIDDAQDNTIFGNYIGTDVHGMASAGFGNAGGSGIGLDTSSTGNLIGGATTAEGNRIFSNAGHGVSVADAGSTGNTISHNSIEYNVGKGIDLPDSWISFAPTIAATTLGSVRITGTACAGCTIEVFQSHLDSGEGLTFVGETTADGGGAFTVTVGSLSAGAPYLTATATDGTNTTSEFSAVFESTIKQVYLPLVLRD
jgi:CSLREA domain-containing protein